MDPCMPTHPPDAQNYFLACFAVSLVKGETILQGTVRSRTVQGYMKAAESLFNDRQITSPLFAKKDYIKIIIRALASYESMEKRRNMLHDSMMLWMIKQAKYAPKDSMITSIVDWTVLGRYTGFRKSEWCQSTRTKYARIAEWIGTPAEALIGADIKFLGHNDERLEHNPSFSDIKTVVITWRKQKNKENGQEIPFERDDNLPDLCPVRAAFRIMQRAGTLLVPKEEPVAVYYQLSAKKRFFITDNQVSSFFKKAAIAVFNLPKSDPELTKYSTHSIRVTAANVLHRANLSDSFIQMRLRWKSDTFLNYLRNTFYAANKHTKSLNISDSNLPPLSERSYRELESHEHLMAPAA